MLETAQNGHRYRALGLVRRSVTVDRLPKLNLSVIQRPLQYADVLKKNDEVRGNLLSWRSCPLELERFLRVQHHPEHRSPDPQIHGSFVAGTSLLRYVRSGKSEH